MTGALSVTSAVKAGGSVLPLVDGVAVAAPPRVLIADDQADVLEALRLLLKPEGFAVETAPSPQAALAAIQAGDFDAVLIDLNYARDTTSGMEGLELLDGLRALDPTLPVVVMTAWASVGLAVEAMRRGAVDFVTKPWDNARLVATLRACLEAHRPGAEPSVPGGVDRRDLLLAHTVQERLLPRSAPRLATLCCAARCEECGPVGGDFYDFLELGRGRLGLAAGDVSGKGVPAAIVMAHLNATLRSLAPQMSEDLVGVAQQVDALLMEALLTQHYVTLFLATYQEEQRLLRYVNCGHVPPIILKASGDVRWLAPTAPAVGLIEAFAARAEEVHLGAGDTLLVYSDGVTETPGPHDEELGPERLLAYLRAAVPAPPEVVVGRILAARRAFASGRQRDDVTVLVAQGRAGEDR